MGNIEAIIEQGRRDRRNALLVRSASNVLYNWAQGHPAEDSMQSLKRVFEAFESDTDINLEHAFRRMEGR